MSAADPSAVLSAMAQQLREGQELRLSVRARPGGGRSCVTGVLADGSLQVTVRAAPEDGAANAELLVVLAEALGVPLSRLRLAGGATARLKRVVVSPLQA